MKINNAKTKVVVCCRNDETQTQIITLDGDALEQVNEYIYLGSKITEDGHSIRGIS